MIATSELRKQISIFVSLSDWRALREEAARLGIPMTELCRRWMANDMNRLRSGQNHSPSAEMSRNRSNPR